MSNLISREAVKQALCQQWFLEILLTKDSKEDMARALRSMIDTIPVDYDMEKVIHKIHCYFIEQIDDANCEDYCRCVNENHAICNIVRSGGIGE